MKKIFWLGVGITIGVVVARKLAAAKGALGPEGLNRAVGSMSDAVHDFSDALRDNMDQRETDLRAALGLDPEKPSTKDHSTPRH